MTGNIKDRIHLAKKKAFELSYALFRICAKSGNPAFHLQIERDAVNLLDATIRGEYNSAKTTIEGIEYFINLGSSIGIIGSGNAGIIFRESRGLQELLSGLSNVSGNPEPDIASIFSTDSAIERKKKVNPAIKEEKKSESGNPRTVRAEQSSHDGNPRTVRAEQSSHDGNPRTERAEQSSYDGNPAIVSGNAKETLDTGGDIDIRREKILQIIRQSGNCRIKDIQDSFPKVSERTIRYDLEVMMSEKLIDRIGGGPGTYYKLYKEIPQESFIVQEA